MTRHGAPSLVRGGWVVVVALAGLSASVPPCAGDAQSRISGQVFGDYFYNLEGSGVVKDDNGFQFRRIYLTADHDLSERITSRLTLEADNAALTSNGKSSPFVKLAFLNFKQVVPGGNLLAGMSSTPLWQTAEAVWGYRSVEKTSLDLRGFGSASDIGVALQGTFGDGAPVGYHVMFGNGNGQKPENDHSKKLYVALPIKESKAVVEPLVDYEGGPGTRDKYTLKLLIGWQEERWAVGGEGFWRNNRGAAPFSGGDVTPVGFDVFGRTKLGDRVGALARYDWFDPNTNQGSIGYVSHYFLAGIDFTPIPDVHLIPNLSVEAYDGKSSLMPDRDADVVGRITLFYSYKE